MTRRSGMILLLLAPLMAACGGDPIEAGGAAGTAQDGTVPVVEEIELADAFMTLRQHPDFTIFADLARRAGLAQRLGGDQPITLFAPTDSAFDKLPEERRAALLDPAQRTALVAFVNAHIVAGRASARDFGEAIVNADGLAKYQTLAGKPLSIERTDLNTAETPPEGEQEIVAAVPGDSSDMLRVSEAGGGSSLVTASDIEATNGVIHALESVLVP